MDESVDQLYQAVHSRFPEISALADSQYQARWGEGWDDFSHSYSWFESLADTLNSEMHRQVDPVVHKGLFEFIRYSYMTGTEDVRKTIDVAFVENLFWQIPKVKAENYWQALPEVLKDLYFRFHRRQPV